MSNTSRVGAPFFRSPEANTSYYTKSRDVWGFGMIIACSYEKHDSPEINYSEVPLSNIPENIMCIKLGKSLMRRYAGYRQWALNVGSEEPLRILTEQCLNYEPKERPTFEEILVSLKGIYSRYF